MLRACQSFPIYSVLSEHSQNIFAALCRVWSALHSVLCIFSFSPGSFDQSRGSKVDVLCLSVRKATAFCRRIKLDDITDTVGDVGRPFCEANSLTMTPVRSKLWEQGRCFMSFRQESDGAPPSNKTRQYRQRELCL